MGPMSSTFMSSPKRIVPRVDLTDIETGGSLHFTLPVAIIMAIIGLVAVFFVVALPVLAWRARSPKRPGRIVRNYGPLLTIGKSGQLRQHSQDEESSCTESTASDREKEPKNVQVMGVFGGDYPKRVDMLRRGSWEHVQSMGALDGENRGNDKGRGRALEDVQERAEEQDKQH